jgi:hypothetical protein
MKLCPKIAEKYLSRILEKRPKSPTLNYVFYALSKFCPQLVHAVYTGSQGCQIVYFKTKNHNLGTFWRSYKKDNL